MFEMAQPSGTLKTRPKIGCQKTFQKPETNLSGFLMYPVFECPVFGCSLYTTFFKDY